MDQHQPDIFKYLAHNQRHNVEEFVIDSGQRYDEHREEIIHRIADLTAE